MLNYSLYILVNMHRVLLCYGFIICQCDLFNHVCQVTSLALGWTTLCVREVTMKEWGKIHWYKTKQSMNGGHSSWSVLDMQISTYFDRIESKYKKLVLNWCTINNRRSCFTWLCLLRFCSGLVYPCIHGDFSGTRAIIKLPWCTSTTLKTMGI